MISRCRHIWDFPWPYYFYNLQLGPRTQLVWYGSGGLVPAILLKWDMEPQQDVFWANPP